MHTKEKNSLKWPLIITAATPVIILLAPYLINALLLWFGLDYTIATNRGDLGVEAITISMLVKEDSMLVTPVLTPAVMLVLSAGFAWQNPNLAGFIRVCTLPMIFALTTIVICVVALWSDIQAASTQELLEVLLYLFGYIITVIAMDLALVGIIIFCRKRFKPLTI